MTSQGYWKRMSTTLFCSAEYLISLHFFLEQNERKFSIFRSVVIISLILILSINFKGQVEKKEIIAQRWLEPTLSKKRVLLKLSHLFLN